MSTRRVFQCTILLVSGGIGLFGGEVFWRSAVAARARGDAERFADPLLERVDGAVGFALKADVDHVETTVDPKGGPPTRTHYRTRPERLREHPAWPPPEGDAVRRVLFVGDSYTFGSCVPVAGTLGEQTAAALRSGGLAVFPINAGVPAYNSEQQLAWLEQLLPRYRPHHVVLGFVMNDAEPVAGLPTPLPDVYGGTWSWLAVDLRQAANALGRWFVDDRPLFASARPTYEADYRRSWGPGSAKVARCRAAVVAMAERCKALGVGFTCAVLPDFTRPFDATYPYGSIHEQVRAWGDAAGFRVVDTLDGLRGADSAALSVPGDGHPTAEGQRRMAVQLAAVLQEQWRG